MPDFSFLVQPLAAALGQSLTLGSTRPIAGGSIHSAWHLETNRGLLFVKSNRIDARPMFEAEADGLKRLAATGTVRTPRVLALGCESDFAWLALEYLELRPLDGAGGARLGERLAALHRHGEERYGLAVDNYIGSTPQINSPHVAWPYFYAHRRLAPMLERAARRGLDRDSVRMGRRLIEGLAGFFVDSRIAPSLLHGDLWSGNAAQLPDGTPVIYDPAAYYGDREADLSMSELFGGFPTRFYAAYRCAWPPAEGYEQRKTLYNLYHMLNHYVLFGDAYLNQARRMLRALAAELGPAR